MSGVIGAATGMAGPWIRRPAEFGKLGTSGCINGANIKVSSTQSFSLNTVSAIATYVAKQGAVASLAVNDAFVTVCDITGAGVVSGFIGPAKETAGTATSTIEVTVDGSVYSLQASLPGGDGAVRHVVGLITALTITAGDGSGPNSGTDDSLALNQANASSALGKSALVYPQTARAYGMAALKFDKGLKVRIKSSAIGAVAESNAVGVLYQLDA